jgi:hypothetical protein
MKKWVALGVVLLVSTHLVLSSMTFCFEKMRPLSDQELIDVTVNQLLERVEPARAAELRGSLARTTDCCTVIRNFSWEDSGRWDKVLHVVTGFTVAAVEIDFGMPSTPDEPVDPTLVTLSACGCLLD